MRRKINEYIKNQYGVGPEYPWQKYDDNAVYRHKDNKKWFALMMNVGRDKLGLSGSGSVSVINLKIDDIIMRDAIIKEEGIMPAYHMNKLHWITVLLDGSVPEDYVKSLLDISYNATATKRRKKQSRGSKEWIIPANPMSKVLSRRTASSIGSREQESLKAIPSICMLQRLCRQSYSSAKCLRRIYRMITGIRICQ